MEIFTEAIKDSFQEQAWAQDCARRLKEVAKHYELLDFETLTPILEEKLAPYDERVVEQIQDWAVGKTKDSLYLDREIEEFAVENERITGTEAQQVLFAIDAFLAVVEPEFIL